MRGFHVNQLYSPTISPQEFALHVIKSRQSQADEQELYNSKLGLPHVAEGNQVTNQQILDAIKSYQKFNSPTNYGWRCMGIDVGKVIHYEIACYTLRQDANPSFDLNTQTHCKVLTFGTVKDFEELDKLMRDFQIHAAVIDANPERRKSYEFACRQNGRVRLCTYPEGQNGRMISENEDQMILSVDRTSWLDMSLGRFKSKSIELPNNTESDYREQIRAPAKRYRKNENGNPIARYECAANKPDHYAHARNYCEIALTLAGSMAQNSSFRF